MKDQVELFEREYPPISNTKYSGERNCWITIGPLGNLSEIVLYNKLWKAYQLGVFNYKGLPGSLVDHPNLLAFTINGKDIKLRTFEYRCLKVLFDNPGKIIDRDQLHHEVNGTEYDGQARTIDVLMSKIRKKLTHNIGIKGLRAKGYMLVNYNLDQESDHE